MRNDMCPTQVRWCLQYGTYLYHMAGHHTYVLKDAMDDRDLWWQPWVPLHVISLDSASIKRWSEGYCTNSTMPGEKEMGNYFIYGNAIQERGWNIVSYHTLWSSTTAPIKEQTSGKRATENINCLIKTVIIISPNNGSEWCDIERVSRPEERWPD